MTRIQLQVVLVMSSKHGIMKTDFIQNELYPATGGTCNKRHQMRNEEN